MANSRDSYLAIAGIPVFTMLIILVVLWVILYQATLESVPLDVGWLGFFFIFGNGFFLSLLLNRSKVGTLERLLLTIGLGFGFTFVVMTLIGLIWDITFFSIVLIETVSLMTLMSVAVTRGFRINWFFSWPKKKSVQVNRNHVFQTLLLAIICIFSTVALFNALSLPTIEWDSLAYGVNYAKIIFQAEKIPLIAGSSIGIEMSANYPPGVQLTAVSFYALAGAPVDFYYRLLSPIFGLATLLVTYKFAMHINKNRTFSVYAVSALTLIPFFWEIFVNETYLMALTLMLTLSAYFFYKAHDADVSEAKKYEVLATMFCGFAALTSYMGLFSLGILLLYSLHKKTVVKRIAFLGGLFVLIIAPWYLRNLFLLGNPVYPFFGFGNYLDPLLRSSTLQHFQQYLTIPLYGWTAKVAQVSTVLLIAGIVFFTFYKRKKDFFVALPLYLLLISILIMALHVAFPRYILLALPALAVVFSTTFKFVPSISKPPKIVVITLIAVVFASALMIPYINNIKPQRQAGEDKWQYLARVIEEGDVWQWINQNTPTNASILTFDIKEYYINRTVFALDGNEAAPLYQMSTVQECIRFLQDKGVKYFLSVPWASPADKRMPPAYDWCILTRVLGDIDYLPPVFVGKNGAAVYHIGSLNETIIDQSFAPKGLVAPIKHVSINVTVSNNTFPSMGQCYLSIPVDYRKGNITVSTNSSKPVDLEFWNELILTDNIDPKSENFMIAKSPYANPSSIGPYSFQWCIDKAGYFTIRVIDKEAAFLRAFNVTLEITFSSLWDLEQT